MLSSESRPYCKSADGALSPAVFQPFPTRAEHSCTCRCTRLSSRERSCARTSLCSTPGATAAPFLRQPAGLFGSSRLRRLSRACTERAGPRAGATRAIVISTGALPMRLRFLSPVRRGVRAHALTFVASLTPGFLCALVNAIRKPLQPAFLLCSGLSTVSLFVSCELWKFAPCCLLSPSPARPRAHLYAPIPLNDIATRSFSLRSASRSFSPPAGQCTASPVARSSA